MNRDQVISLHFPEVQQRYGVRDTMLYALSVGACQDSLAAGDLRLVYEAGLQALPSMASVLAHPGLWVKQPDLGIDWLRLVHAEQSFEMQRPLPAEGLVTARHHVTGITDKGIDKGALLNFRKSLHAEDGGLVGTVDSVYFLRGDGGCGSFGEPGAELPTTPTRDADGSVDIALSDSAALLYRLNGDYNPLHADPAVARKAGFDRPILHGLCTYGVACQSLIRGVCDYDATRLISMGARFTKPVFPGETLRTQWWRGDGQWLHFRCISVDRGLVVLDRGQARIAAA
jgi:acyl dehydratase